jgi:bifunctional non-homologous end joining protein LigD
VAKDRASYALSRGYRLAYAARPGELRGDAARYVIELAWDGHRVLACRAGRDVRLVSGDFREWTDAFPSVARALTLLPARDVIVEGHVCALDEAARPSFELLRAHVRKAPARVVFVAWDLLHLDGEDLRPIALAERRARLARLLAGAREPLVLSEALTGELPVLLDGAKKLGVHGLVARAAASAYPPPRDDAWIALGETFGDRSLSPPPVVTKADKVLYPRDGFTKADVVGYYADVASVLVPYLVDRPVVAQRWPDGIDEFTWYQHRMPPRAPDYVRAVWIDKDRRIVLDNPDALAWFANQAALTIHAWASRVGSLEQPDWATIDLDPGERTTWAETVEVANALRRLLELLDLPSVPKTSGQKGLHVLVPLAPGHTLEEANELARRAGEMLARLMPDTVSLALEREKRGGRLFVDTLQNFVGKGLVSAYSLRAANGAPVSTPLDWSEVTPKLDPRAFNLRTLRARLDAKGDLARPLLDRRVSISSALARLRAG